MSTVGVVIPCYCYGAYLQQCVASALNDQPGIDVRVLIIDDASPDDSAQYARSLGKRDKRIEVIVHEKNRGHIATYNEGLLDWATTDYVALLSADDMLTPGALTRAVGLLDAHPEVGFAYGRPVHFTSGQSLPRPRTTTRGWSVWDGQWWLQRRFHQPYNVITAPEVVVRRSVQTRVGGYNPDLPHAGDLEMWLRLASIADVGYLRGVDQAYYRVHSTSMSRTVYSSKLQDLVQRREVYESVLTSCPDIDATRLRAAAYRSLAAEALRHASSAYDRGRVDVMDVSALVRFAAETWPPALEGSAYRGLRFRQAVGARVMPLLRPVVLPPIAHRIRNEIWWASWRHRGI